MIRLNGSWPSMLRREPGLERAVVQQPGQVVGLGPDLDRLVDLGVLERDRHLGGEQLDELELVLRVAVLEAEPLERQDAGRALAAAQRDAIRLPSTAPSRKWLTRGRRSARRRRAPARCGRRPRSRGPPRRATTA